MEEQQNMMETEARSQPTEQTEETVSSETQAQTLEQLSARIQELEEELELRDKVTSRMTRECEEFETYFPEVSLRELPDSVWTQVHAGVPLAAAYALYERGIHNQRLAAEQQNARNAALSPGMPGETQQRYFSPSQVRAMSRREVRENYDRIFESMRHWQ